MATSVGLENAVWISERHITADIGKNPLDKLTRDVDHEIQLLSVKKEANLGVPGNRIYVVFDGFFRELKLYFVRTLRIQQNLQISDIFL